MVRLACPLLLGLFLLVPFQPLQAQPAFLVEDIRDGEERIDWYSLYASVELDGVVYFAMDDGIYGVELWRSDGTEAGTRMVADLCAGICSSAPMDLTVAGDALFFLAHDGFHGHALWKTDGTGEGTVRLKELTLLTDIQLTAAGGLVFFAAASEDTGTELWRTDGTTAGTFQLGDLKAGSGGSNPILLGALGDACFFSAEDLFHGRELWKSDGTAAGTVMVKDLYPGLDSSLYLITQWPQRIYPEVGGRLVFPASDNAGHGLWASDGTAAGTQKISTVSPSPEVSFAKAGGTVFFSGYTQAHGRELWKTDGTAAGTALVQNIHPSGDSFPQELTTVSNRIYFRAFNPGVACPLWTSDGTAAGTASLCPMPFSMEGSSSGYNAMLALGNKLVFYAYEGSTGNEPWVSDGTAAGTTLLKDIYPGISSSFGGGTFPGTRLDGGAVVGGIWIFRALTPDGWGIWKSDGTAAGTELVFQQALAKKSGIGRSPELVDLDGSLIFPAYDGSSWEGPWISDGTAPGTGLILDLDGSTSPSIGSLVRFGQHVYFDYNGHTWKTDGTAAGTEPYFLNNMRKLTPAGPYLYFVVDNLFQYLYRTDGTTLTQITTDGAWFGQLTPVGSNLFFHALYQADDELWKTAGEPGDIVELDIFPGGPSMPEAITAFGSSAVLSADDGSTGRELWLSDGSPAGTRRVKDIRPGVGSSKPGDIVEAGNLVFFLADDGIAGRELWKSDGTAPGTTRVKDIRPGIEPSWIQGITALGGRVFFAADDGVHGVELWASDGTSGGTYLVEDVNPGAASSFPRSLTAAGHLLLYAADDGTHGLEPWKSDGTAAGTSLIQDISPGSGPSSPASFTLSGAHLFFAAHDGEHGFELWALDRSELGSALAANKRVLTPAFEEGTVTWEIVVTNVGAGPHPDNPGPEMTDTLPAPLALTGAAASSGTVTVIQVENHMEWNGALEPGESATITVEAYIPSSTERQTFFNQAQVAFDADGNGSNESAGVSDDPGRPGSGQPTPVVISSAPLDFHTVAPCRILGTTLHNGNVQTLTLGGVCGVPGSARAVAANLTVLNATGGGRIVAYPAGLDTPATSTLNFTAGGARANNALLGLVAGQVDALATIPGGGTVHLFLDVTGYYE